MDGDFTVEWFMYRPTTGNTYMWTVGDSKTSTGLELYWGSSGNLLNYIQIMVLRIFREMP